MLRGLSACLFFFVLLTLSLAKAQTEKTSSDDGDVNGIEQQIEKQEKPSSEVLAPVHLAPVKVSPTVDFSALANSQTSTDTVIIQRNYMPKTERLQFFGGVSLSPNDVFYRTYGLQARVAYHFSEALGLELLGVALNSTKGAEVNELENNTNGNGQAVSDLVSPKSYMGLDVYLNSLYGKAALLDNKIVNYEIYESIGLGEMNTTTSKGSAALHLGLGELFSLSRSSAVRLDLSLFLFNSVDVNGQSTLSNAMLLTFGYGYFYPGAQYR